MKSVLLVTLAIVFLFSFVLTGCGTKAIETPTITDKPEATQSPEVTKAPEATVVPEASTAAVEYKESPYFAGKSLPPVKDRLPKEPKITNEIPKDQMNYEIGIYGGTIRTVTPYDWNGVVMGASVEPLLNTPGLLGNEFTGNILKGYEVTADQKEYTFHMREGLKWSDGKPATAKDVQFTFEDVLFNKELTSSLPAWMCGGNTAGKPLKFTMVDDFTFKFTFDKPYGGLPIYMAIQNFEGYTEFLKPSAFLKKYHKKYNTDTVALEAEIKAAKFKPGEWVNLFRSKDVDDWHTTYPKSIGFPCLRPWLHTKMTDTVSEFERNPYYFKVDTAGNQLPYVDKIISTYVNNVEVITVKIIAGELDYVRENVAINKMPLYKENEAKGGYKTHLLDMTSSAADVYLGLTFKNENWRKVVQDERFRKALSLGINRKEIIDSVYFGFAEPSTFMDTTYDVAAANKLLDEMGMTKGADGFRKGPDGKKFTIPFEIFAGGPDWVPATELIVEQWKALGLDVTMKTIDIALWGIRRDANALQATVMWRDTALWYNREWGQELWGSLWAMNITTAGKQGEKPPADVQKWYDLITKIAMDKPEDARAAAIALRNEIKVHNWYFPYLSNVKLPVIVNAKIGNIPDKGFAIAADCSMEQFFFKK